MPTLDTPRLRLISLSTDALTGLAAGASAPVIADMSCDPELVDRPVERAIGMKLERMQSAPLEDHPWLTYWAVLLRSEGRAIGLLGFKGPPSDEGSVEIGYGIAPGYRNRGLTTEAAACLVGWAFSDPRCAAVTAVGVRPGNTASERVLRKLGARLVRRGGSGSDWRIDASRR